MLNSMNNEDLRQLRDKLFEIGRETLSKGHFFPGNAAMKTNGEIILSVCPLEANEAAQTMTGILNEQAKSKEIRAAGVLLDVTFTPPEASAPVDALVVVLEHENGEAYVVHLTYHKGLFGKIKFGSEYEEPSPMMKIFTETAGNAPGDPGAQSEDPKLDLYESAIKFGLERAAILLAAGMEEFCFVIVGAGQDVQFVEINIELWCSRKTGQVV